MKQYVFGVDIGGTTVKIGLFRTSGELLEKWEIPTRTEQDGAFILPDIADSIRAKALEREIAPDDVEGVGVGVPGPVSDDGVVHRCVNRGWGVMNVETILSGLTGWKVRAGNDANVAAMGEKWQGSGKGYRSLVVVTLGTGVGGGVIVNGSVLGGFHGAGGEIGHITVNPAETEVCGCGKKGCLEQYTSATGIARLAKRYLAAHDTDSVLRTMTEITAKDVFDAAKTGDPVSLAVVESFGEILGRTLAGIACTLDPEVFIIGGGVSKAGAIVTDIIKKYYTMYAFHATRDTEFRIATLGNDAGIYGGAGLLLGG